MNYGAEVLTGGHGQQQRRQLQPHLTRSLCRRSDDCLRCGWRHLGLRGGGTRRPDRALGLQRAGDPPDLLPPRAAGHPSGTRMYSWTRATPPRRSGPTRWLGLDVGTDIALANTIGREIIHAGLVNEAFVQRATSGFDDYRATVEPYTLERPRRSPASRRRRSASSRTPTPRRPRPDLLDARDHRAPQRGGQRVRADQPRPPHGARRPLRLRSRPAARAEQRAGRRRHGRDSGEAARRLRPR